MKLVFLGTRGSIEPRSRRHRRHTSTLVSYRRKRVLIDCGEDWRGKAGAEDPGCARSGVPEMIVTHCGPAIVGGDERRVEPKLRELSEASGVSSQIAHDGMDRVLR